MVQKVRVFKLAREFGVENEVMVNKVRNLGFAVRNYMSPLEVDDAQRVRRLLEREREENTVEELIRPTVIRRRTKTGAPVRPTQAHPAEADAVVEATGPTGAGAAAEPGAPEPLVPIAEEAPAPVPAAGPAETTLEAALAAVGAADLTAPVQPAGAEDLPAAGEPPGTQEIIPISAEKDHLPPIAEAQEFQSRRPASEAPVIRRRIAATPPRPADGEFPQRRGKSAPQRRRQVESREMTPSRRFGGAAKFGGPPARKRRMTPGKKGKKTEITVPKASKRVIRIEEQITLQELAKRMSIKATELLMKLIGLGMAGININSTLDSDTAKIVAEEFGYDVEDVAVAEEELLASTRSEESDEEKKLRVPRAPIVTMMGHVDHGKTSLLDAIRKSNVVAGEAGGITQHIGAYRVKAGGGQLTFIDTPGHEAFTSMRARGANVTDIVVLVVAADDGVMPQTIEAINHARAAEVPILVAINKCDLPGADTERTRRMLMEHNLVPEDLGGDTIMAEVSAKTGEGLDRLLEMIALQSEVMELDANPQRPGAGVVLEAYLDRGRGPVANVLVQEGTVTVGEVLVAGSVYGKIRALTDDHGRKISDGGPATPLEVLGLNGVPGAGDTFDVVADMKLAEKVGQTRAEKAKVSPAAPSQPSLEALYQQMQNAEQVELKLIVKTDVQGTMEALRDALTKLSGEKVKVSVVHASVGGITNSDVLLASTAGAIIVGFNVRPAGKARKLAEEQSIEIKIFSVIYEAVDAVKQSMVGLLEPEVEEEQLGQVEVRDTFSIPKVGTIAGSYVTEGKVTRNARARLIRDSVQIWEGKLGSLRRFKDDVREVQSGFECGIALEGYNDIKVGDVIEVFTEKQVEATLS
jgi:translation initiation factor IF-2